MQKDKMKKKYRIYNLYECVFPAGDHDTLEEAIEDCRRQLFESLFTDELIIVNTLKDKIVRRIYWRDCNVGGKMYKPELKSESKSKPACPKCGGQETIPILYGYPSPATLRKWKRKEVELGGCCIGNNDPQWYCKNCQKNFGRLVRRKNE